MQLRKVRMSVQTNATKPASSTTVQTSRGTPASAKASALRAGQPRLECQHWPVAGGGGAFGG